MITCVQCGAIADEHAELPAGGGRRAQRFCWSALCPECAEERSREDQQIGRTIALLERFEAAALTGILARGEELPEVETLTTTAELAADIAEAQVAAHVRRVVHIRESAAVARGYRFATALRIPEPTAPAAAAAPPNAAAEQRQAG